MNEITKIHKFAIIKPDGEYETFEETQKRIHDEREERKKSENWIGPLRYRKKKLKKKPIKKKKTPKKKKPINYKPIKTKKKVIKKKVIKKKTKKNKKRSTKHLFVTRYLLVTMNRGKRDKFIGKYSNPEDAYTAFNQLLDESNNIPFPMKFNNSHGLRPVKYELAILKKVENDFESNENILKNESGQLVPHILINTEDWYILDKENYNIEETFFVYGYHPRKQRKTFQWIYENFIINELADSDMFKRVFVFLNKLVIVYDDNDIDMVICKNMQDAIRLYNLLEVCVKKAKKTKRILFMGNVSLQSENRKRICEYIKNKTNWLDKKILRKNTRP